MAGSLTISGLSAGEPAGQRTFGPLPITGSTVVGETLESILASGDNTFAIPAGSVAALIIAPVNGTAVLKVRTSANSGDAGLPIAAANLPMVYPFPAALPTSLIVNSSAGQTNPMTIAFV